MVLDVKLLWWFGYLEDYIGLWYNGSTEDFGSSSRGSNPLSPTIMNACDSVLVTEMLKPEISAACEGGTYFRYTRSGVKKNALPHPHGHDRA